MMTNSENDQIIFRYDQSFDGLLCCIFESYTQKIMPKMLISNNTPTPLFITQQINILTDSYKAQRVWKGLQKKLSSIGLSIILLNWQSELSENDWLLFQYIRKIFDSSYSIELNFGDPIVLKIHQIAKKVSHEQHQMIQFLRFQKMADNCFFATIEPLYNVLPTIIQHFKKRFADQNWLIYDVKREYGYYYDQQNVTEVHFQEKNPKLKNGLLPQQVLDASELLFQKMWKEYFTTICIQERKNPKLHRKNLPIRFWKYLPEKNNKS